MNILTSTNQSDNHYTELSLAGGAGGTLAEFGSSVNPIPTRGGRLCQPRYCEHPRILKPNDIADM